SSTSVVLNGGTLGTSGSNQSVGTLSLLSNAALDLGGGQSTTRFAASNAIVWSGQLSIANWDGDWRNGNGADRVLFGSSSGGLTAGQLNEIQFDGFPIGAAILPSGEVIPSSAPLPLAGDLDRDAHVTVSDISALTGALADLNSYQAVNQLSDTDFKTLADV